MNSENRKEIAILGVAGQFERPLRAHCGWRRQMRRFSKADAYPRGALSDHGGPGLTHRWGRFTPSVQRD